MRGIIVAIVLLAGCSSNESIAPASAPSPVGSIAIEGPDAMAVSDSVRLNVSLLDARSSPVANRPVTFASSNARVATVDKVGVIRALAEGCVTITVSSEKVSARKLVAIFRLRAGLASDERYRLVLVDGQPLPVPSPWGVGEWDYDEDAGTWKLTQAEIVLFGNGCFFTYMNTHRAASGNTIRETSSGRYSRGQDSVELSPDFGSPWSVSVTAGRLVERWSDGRTLVYER